MPKCSRCDAEVPGDSRYCGKCGFDKEVNGKPVQPVAPPPPPIQAQQPYPYQQAQQAPKKKGHAGAVVGVIFIVLLLLGGAVAYSAYQANRNYTPYNIEPAKPDENDTDSDGDGVMDGIEDLYGWNKNSKDTDGDGVDDGDDIDPLTDVVVIIDFTHVKVNSNGNWNTDDMFTECDTYLRVSVSGTSGSTTSIIESWNSPIVENKNDVSTSRKWTYNAPDDKETLPSFTFQLFDSDTVKPDDQLIEIGEDDWFMLVEMMYYDLTYLEDSFTTTTSGTDAEITYSVTIQSHDYD